MKQRLKIYDVKSVHLEITGRCNLSCIYCYNSQFNDKKKISEEMSTEDIRRLIKEASEMGCNSFTFSGGDPFLRNDIFKIIEFCKNKKVNFLTNAKLLTKNFMLNILNLAKILSINSEHGQLMNMDILTVMF